MSKDTLLGVLNRTRTGMGARLLRNWLVRPSIDPAGNRIAARCGRRAGSVRSRCWRKSRTSFEGMFDLERLLSKITVGTASPRELTALRSSIGRLPAIAKALGDSEGGALRRSSRPAGSSRGPARPAEKVHQRRSPICAGRWRCDSRRLSCRTRRTAVAFERTARHISPPSKSANASEPESDR